VGFCDGIAAWLLGCSAGARDGASAWAVLREQERDPGCGECRQSAPRPCRTAPHGGGQRAR
jgi:hypothetical protein